MNLQMNHVETGTWIKWQIQGGSGSALILKNQKVESDLIHEEKFENILSPHSFKHFISCILFFYAPIYGGNVFIYKKENKKLVTIQIIVI